MVIMTSLNGFSCFYCNFISNWRETSKLNFQAEFAPEKSHFMPLLITFSISSVPPPDSQKHNILLNWQNSVIIYYKASCSSSFFFNTGQNTYWDYWQSKKLHQNKMPWGIITLCWEEQSCLLIPGLMSSQANCFIERQKVSYVR